MKSFLENQNLFVDYIKLNYGEYLNQYGIDKPEIITEFLDLDRYKNNFCCFIEFSKIEFPQSKFNDDCETLHRLQVSVYLVFRNDTIKNIRENLQNATFAFYSMLNEKRISSVANCNLTGIEFYNYVEGNKFLVASQLSLNLEM